MEDAADQPRLLRWLLGVAGIGRMLRMDPPRVGTSDAGATPPTLSDWADSITWQGNVLKELTLRDGVASTTLRGLPASERTFRIAYHQTASVTATSLRRTVSIR